MLHHGRNVLLAGLVLGIITAWAFLTGCTFIMWGFASWFGENAPQWERNLNTACALGLMLLQASLLILSPLVVYSAINSRIRPNYAGQFWPRGILQLALGVGLLCAAGLFAAIVSEPWLYELLDGWWLMLIATNGLLSITAAIDLALCQEPLSGGSRSAVRRQRVLWFTIGAMVVYAAVVTLMMGPMATLIEATVRGPASDEPQFSVGMIRLGLSLALSVPVAIAWRRGSTALGVTGVLLAAFVCAGAWYFAPLFQSEGSYAGGWFAVVVSTIPLLLLLPVVAIRCYRTQVGRVRSGA